MTTKHDVISMHKAHPKWSAPRIAVALKCGAEYVRATAKRNFLSLPPSRPQQSAEQIAHEIARLQKRMTKLRALLAQQQRAAA